MWIVTGTAVRYLAMLLLHLVPLVAVQAKVRDALDEEPFNPGFVGIVAY
jgi:hypothetical protein